MNARLAWAPFALLLVGAITAARVGVQHLPPLRMPLEMAIPSVIAGIPGRDEPLADDERQAVGVTSYLMRAFATPDTGAAAEQFSLYVGYYDHQTQGSTIHSPKNCLPGAGWQALSSQTAVIEGPTGPTVVNRYLLQYRTERALVLYWYQGRGRIQANEYKVKLNLLRDAALRGRSEEALVRIIVPVRDSEERAYALAARAARSVMPALWAALPT